MSVPYIDNDNDITLPTLILAKTRAHITDAVIIFTVNDSQGNPVAGATAVSMPYTATTASEYRGTYLETVVLVAGDKYEVVITSTNKGIKWQHPATAKIRR